MIRTRFIVALLAASLASCSSGDGGGSSATFSCAYMPGSVSNVSAASGTGNVSQASAVTDANQATAATINGGVGGISGTIRSNYTGPDFPAGANVGMLVTFGNGATTAGVTLNTYLGNTPRESISGAALNSRSTGGTTPAELYVSFKSTLSFDSLELAYAAAGGQTYTIHEFCGDS